MLHYLYLDYGGLDRMGPGPLPAGTERQSDFAAPGIGGGGGCPDRGLAPRIYANRPNQTEKNLSPDWHDLTPPKEWVKMDSWKIRAYDCYYGAIHMFDGWRK